MEVASHYILLENCPDINDAAHLAHIFMLLHNSNKTE